jgi:hypothetical protein
MGWGGGGKQLEPEERMATDAAKGTAAWEMERVTGRGSVWSSKGPWASHHYWGGGGVVAVYSL